VRQLQVDEDEAALNTASLIANIKARGGTIMEIRTRVRLVKDVDNYPTCLIRAGETGTLMRITDEGTYWIKLDKHHPELDD
jgi:hypothetical protein